MPDPYVVGPLTAADVYLLLDAIRVRQHQLEKRIARSPVGVEAHRPMRDALARLADVLTAAMERRTP